jgi:hypothetical protein
MTQSEAKTRPTPVTVADFLDRVEPPARRDDGHALDQLFRHVTGWQPKMWGPSMVGYGRYAYRYDSGRTGEMFATGFSPRKAELVVYTPAGYESQAEALARLGKHKLGKSCLYIKRLSDIDAGVLAEIIRAGLADLARRYPVTPD